MARRKNNFINVLLDILEKSSPLYTFYLLYLYFTNKAAFWNQLNSLIVILAIIIAGIIFWEKHKRAQRIKIGQKLYSDRELLTWLRQLKPSEFEKFVADLFSKLGYKTEVTGGSHDEGIDVIAEKDGIKHYVQCKRYNNSVVGVPAVREFYGAITAHLTNDKAYFITTNKFTLEAEKFAEDKPIELVDGTQLVKYIHLAEKNNNTQALVFKQQVKFCPDCGGNLIERSGKFERFYGCSNFPRCKFTKDMIEK